MGEFMNDPNFEFLRDFDENIHKTCCEIDLLIYNKFYNASLNASRRAVENLLRNVYGIKKDVDFNFILRNYERKIDDSIYEDLYYIKDKGNMGSHNLSSNNKISDNRYKQFADEVAKRVHKITKFFYEQKNGFIEIEYRTITGNEDYFKNVDDDELKKIIEEFDVVVSERFENMQNQINKLNGSVQKLCQNNLIGNIDSIVKDIEEIKNSQSNDNAIEIQLNNITNVVKGLQEDYSQIKSINIDKLMDEINSINNTQNMDDVESKLNEVAVNINILKENVNSIQSVNVDDLINQIEEIKDNQDIDSIKNYLKSLNDKFKSLDDFVKNMDNFSSENEDSESQKRAITSKSNKLIINAGPGSGKTRVLVKRVKYLLDTKHVDPRSILVITFTEKAADQLKSRLINMDIPPEDINQMQISTIHGFCSTLLRDYYSSGVEIVDDKYNNHKTLFIKKHRQALGFTGPNFVPEKELNIVSSKFDEYARFQVDINAFINFINRKYFRLEKKKARAKKDEEFVSFVNQRIAETGEFPIGEVKRNRDYNKRWHAHKFLAIVEAYPKYLNILEEEKAYDFNYLQQKTNEYLKDEENLNKVFYKNIFIDEFQDTDAIQIEIFESLLKVCDTFTIVGDPDQSIYGWRASDPDYFYQFWNDDTFESVELEDNFRSTKEIIDFNENYFSRYRKKDKKLHPHREEEGNVFYMSSRDRGEQAKNIVNAIKHLKKSNKIKNYSDVVILCRSVKTKNIGELLHELDDCEIKYSITGLNNLKDKTEINAFATLIWYLTNKMPDIEGFNLDLFMDDELNNEVFKLDKTTMDVLAKYLDSPQIFSSFDKTQLMDSGIVNDKDLEFFTNLNNLKKNYHSGNNELDILALYYKLFKVTGYIESKFNDTEEYKSHSELLNLALISKIINEFMSVIDRFDIDAFFEYLINNYERYSSPENELEDSQKVKIMTVHGAKGLEFPVVFLYSLDQNFPMPYFSNNKDDPFNPNYPTELKFFKRFKNLRNAAELDRIKRNEEEHRLIYVATTRAMDTLIVSHVDNNKKKNFELDIMKHENPNLEMLNSDNLRLLKKSSSSQDKEEDIIDISFTSLVDYNKCPHGYDLVHNYEFVQPQNKQMYVGTVIHSALDKIHREAIANGNENIEEHIEEVLDEARISNPSLKDDSGFEGSLDAVEEYWEDYGEDQYILDSELPFTIKENGFNLVGKIDLIIQDPEDSSKISVVDFKTTSMDSIDEDYENYRNQLHLYALALTYNSHYVEKNEMNYVFTVNDCDVNNIPVNQNKLTELKNISYNVASKIKNKEFSKEQYDDIGVKKCEKCLLKDFCVE